MHLLFERLRTHRLTATFSLLATLSAAIIAGSVPRSRSPWQGKQNSSSDAPPLKIPSHGQSARTTLSRIAKQVGPAVVNINTETLPKQSANGGAQLRSRSQPTSRVHGDGDDRQRSAGQDQDDMQDFFNRFFGGQGPGGDDGGDGMASERESLGSGFIVDSRGYIITNNHVVDKADKIYVKLSTDPDSAGTRPSRARRRRRQGDRHRRHQDRHRTPLPTVKLGNSDGAQVGDWVLAIGSPFSLSRPSPPASSPPRTAPSMSRRRPASSSTSSRRTPPSIPATPAARWSIWPARSSA